MTARVVVLGGGASGLSAAYAARDAGADVTVILGRAGATALSSGALDGASPPGPESPLVTKFLAALGAWEVTPEPCAVAMRSGLLREAAGRDRSVLDLAALRDGAVGVVAAPRHGWDADHLARAWTEDPWAVARKLRFEAVPVEILRFTHEATAPDVDLALAHDDPTRVAWLVERLRHAPGLSDKRAVLVGPWLGTRPGLAASIGLALGKPIGEPLSPPGGVAGLRFEGARADFLRHLGVACVSGWATSAKLERDGVRVTLSSGTAITADSVVLAVGGVVSGGIAFAPAERFTLAVDAPAVLAMRGAPLVASGSPHGAPFEAFAWSGHEARAGIERVGIWASDDGNVRSIDGAAHPAFYAAGDAVADAPRTMMDAIRSGVRAGRAAATATLAA